MDYKKSLEALDQSLQDLRGNIRPFENALILLARDLRQKLPVIPRSTLADEINACLKYSTLWYHVKTLKLTTNVRVQQQNDPSAEIFSRQFLEIWNGIVPVDLTSGRISLSHNFRNLVTSKEELVEKVFPNIQNDYEDHDWLSERAILEAKNKDVYELSNIIQSNIQSEAVTYKYVDIVVEADEAVNDPTEFLNSLDLPGIPPHVLQLKIVTINKAQGQSLDMCSLYQDMDYFSHGQLYVACSRVGKPDNLYISTDNGTTKSMTSGGNRVNFTDCPCVASASGNWVSIDLGDVHNITSVSVTTSFGNQSILLTNATIHTEPQQRMAGTASKPINMDKPEE
ncbi:uncharacterized protein [Procambarus clarkii]|uniref:uncharacterized protein n=1 Tax=Procambarus clarkii TaxID=6728 RepID=UPI003743582C